LQLKAALAGAQGIRINEVCFVATDSRLKDASMAAQLAVASLGKDQDKFTDLLNDPHKLLELIAAAQGAKGDGATGTGTSGPGAGGSGLGFGSPGGAGPGGGVQEVRVQDWADRAAGVQEVRVQDWADRAAEVQEVWAQVQADRAAEVQEVGDQVQEVSVQGRVDQEAEQAAVGKRQARGPELAAMAARLLFREWLPVSQEEPRAGAASRRKKSFSDSWSIDEFRQC